jgi:hypothetical protein
MKYLVELLREVYTVFILILSIFIEQLYLIGLASQSAMENKLKLMI